MPTRHVLFGGSAASSHISAPLVFVCRHFARPVTRVARRLSPTLSTCAPPFAPRDPHTKSTMAETAVQKPEEEVISEAKLVPEITTKHPLQNTWQLWYYKNVSSDFEKNLFQITSVETVEDFWGLINHIEFASKLNPNCAYYFFKKGIRPMWEDYTNKNGGRWVINCRKGQNKVTDNYWLEILLCLIGEAFGDFNDFVCGAFVVIKNKNDRIGVWTKQSSDRDSNIHIGKVIKSRTNYNGTITYESHDSARKNCYSV